MNKLPSSANLMEAIEAAEKEIEHLKKSNSRQSKSKKVLIQKAVNNAYSTLNKRDYTSKELLIREDNIWEAMKEGNRNSLVYWLWELLILAALLFSV